MVDSIPPLSPRLTETLSINAPVLQSGMGGVAGPDLVAAVSNAGGLGILAALRLEPDQLRSSIRRVRELTDRPFGVNIWLHEDVRTPPNPSTLSDDQVRVVQSVLNELRQRFDLAPTLERPDREPDLVNDALQVMIDERIPVFSAAIGVPESSLVQRFHDVGTTTISMVANVADAAAATANGVDVLVAQGSDAGGHRSYGSKLDKRDAVGSSTLTLVPAVIDAIGGAIPVVAAGGIVDGRGLAAMLALGADGVLLGTRFVATRESAASEIWKQRMISGTRTTALTDGFTGQWARVLQSEFTEHWEASGAVPLPGLLQAAAGRDLFAMAKRVGDDQMQPLYAGAAVGLLTDVPGAGEVVEMMVAEARAQLSRLKA